MYGDKLGIEYLDPTFVNSKGTKRGSFKEEPILVKFKDAIEQVLGMQVSLLMVNEYIKSARFTGKRKSGIKAVDISKVAFERNMIYLNQFADRNTQVLLKIKYDYENIMDKVGELEKDKVYTDPEGKFIAVPIDQADAYTKQNPTKRKLNRHQKDAAMAVFVPSINEIFDEKIAPLYKLYVEKLGISEKDKNGKEIHEYFNTDDYAGGYRNKLKSLQGIDYDEIRAKIPDLTKYSNQMIDQYIQEMFDYQENNTKRDLKSVDIYNQLDKYFNELESIYNADKAVMTTLAMRTLLEDLKLNNTIENILQGNTLLKDADFVTLMKRWVLASSMYPSSVTQSDINWMIKKGIISNNS